MSYVLSDDFQKRAPSRLDRSASRNTCPAFTPRALSVETALEHHADLRFASNDALLKSIGCPPKVEATLGPRLYSIGHEIGSMSDVISF